jgi:hypothetical protein
VLYQFEPKFICDSVNLFVFLPIMLGKVKEKGKVHPRKGNEGPEG